MTFALGSAIAVLALAGAVAVGSWRARRALQPELRALRAQVRELSARLASLDRVRSGRVGGAEPVPRAQAPEDDPQVVRGSRTVH